MKISTQNLIGGFRRHAREHIGRDADLRRGSGERREHARVLRLFHGQPAGPGHENINRDVFVRMVAAKAEWE